jgi:hypothetical protein
MTPAIKQHSRPGPKPTPFLQPDRRFLAQLQRAINAGVARLHLHKAAGCCSDRGFDRILEGKAHRTPVSLMAAGVIGDMIGCPPDQIVDGLALPPQDPTFTLDALQRLADLSKRAHARAFIYRRIAEIEQQVARGERSAA